MENYRIKSKHLLLTSRKYKYLMLSVVVTLSYVSSWFHVRVLSLSQDSIKLVSMWFKIVLIMVPSLSDVFSKHFKLPHHVFVSRFSDLSEVGL